MDKGEYMNLVTVPIRELIGKPIEGVMAQVVSSPYISPINPPQWTKLQAIKRHKPYKESKAYWIELFYDKPSGASCGFKGHSEGSIYADECNIQLEESVAQSLGLVPLTLFA